MATNYNITDLFNISSDGVKIPTYAQIRDALVKDYRAIYGNDVEFSSASADGQFVSMEAQILQRIYQALDNVATNLDPSTATGRSLDILGSLANVHRNPATRSKTTIWIKYIGDSEAILSPTSLTLIDKNNQEWKWWNKKTSTSDTGYYTNFKKGDDWTPLEFTCKNIGTVEAYGVRAYEGTTYSSFSALKEKVESAEGTFENSSFFANNKGTIYQTISNGDYVIFEFSDAITGTDRETDTSLRRRLTTEQGSTSTTLLNSVKAKIVQIEGVEDCVVIDNTENISGLQVSEYVGDVGDACNAVIPYHNVYIVVRTQTSESDNLNYQIGNKIYLSLTPGCSTMLDGENEEENAITVGSGTRQSQKLLLGTIGNKAYYSTVYWTEATPVAPQITVGLNVIDYASVISSKQKEKFNEILTYLNELEIGSVITSGAIMSKFLSYDIKANGSTAFIPSSCTINGGNIYDIGLTYCKYSNVKIVALTDSATITIS